MIQLVGAIIFMYGENMRGVHNLFPNSIDGYKAETDYKTECPLSSGNVTAMACGYATATPLGQQANMGVYYYFGFWFANWVWIIVPVYFIWECTMEIADAIEMRGSVKQLLQNAFEDPDQFQAAVKDEFNLDDGDEDEAEESYEEEGEEEAEAESSDAEDDEDDANLMDAVEGHQDEEQDEDEEGDEEEEGEGEQSEEEEEDEEETPAPRRSRKSNAPQRRAASRPRGKVANKAKSPSRKWGSG